MPMNTVTSQHVRDSVRKIGSSLFPTLPYLGSLGQNLYLYSVRQNLWATQDDYVKNLKNLSFLDTCPSSLSR